MTKYHIVRVLGDDVSGTDVAALLKLLEDAKREPHAPDPFGSVKPEPEIREQADYWVRVRLGRASLGEWAIAYLCREGWEPFAGDSNEYLFRRTVEA